MPASYLRSIPENFALINDSEQADYLDVIQRDVADTLCNFRARDNLLQQPILYLLEIPCHAATTKAGRLLRVYPVESAKSDCLVSKVTPAGFAGSTLVSSAIESDASMHNTVNLMWRKVRRSGCGNRCFESRGEEDGHEHISCFVPRLRVKLADKLNQPWTVHSAVYCSCVCYNTQSKWSTNVHRQLYIKEARKGCTLKMTCY